MEIKWRNDQSQQLSARGQIKVGDLIQGFSTIRIAYRKNAASGC